MRPLTALLILFTLYQNQLFCQNISAKHNGKIGLSVSAFGNNDVFRFQELDGAAGFEGDYFYSAGVHYVLAINSWLDTEMGLEYSKHQITLIPNIPPQTSLVLEKIQLNFVQVPFYLRANFLKYCFVNGGLFLEWDPNKNSDIDNQTGVGAMLGFAFQYNFKQGFSVFLNPYTKLHSLFPFQDRSYHQRILESGFRLGVAFQIPE